MAYTPARTPVANGRVNLHPRPWSRSVVLLVLLSSAVNASGKELIFRNPRDLLAGDLAAFIAMLEAAKPAPVSMEDMGATLRALPPDGEVTQLGAPAQQKVDAVRQLLKSTRRDWYEIKVIDLPQAAIALHARALLLISAPAVALLSAAELQAMAAHEIGHEYVWIEWNGARQRADRDRLKELELICDAIAAVILRQLGMDPSKVIEGVEKVTRFNRERFGSATHENSYPTLGERRAFAREIDRWLRDSSWRSHSGLDEIQQISHTIIPRARGDTSMPRYRARRPAAATSSDCVQNAQRRAAMGTSLRHSGHFFVVGSAGASPLRRRSITAFIGSTTKK